MNKIVFIILLSVLVIFIICIITENTSLPANDAPQQNILYSYGLFSDEPLSDSMKSIIQSNQDITQLNYDVLGYDEVMKDIKQVPVLNLKETYDKIPRGVSKSDLARLIHLYVRGGHYADLDVEFSIKPVINKNQVILYTENYAPLPRIANYAISAPPNHPFILEVITEITQRVVNKNKEIWTDDDVLQTTGPDVITDIYRTWKYSDVKRIGLIKSNKILRHNAAGTWRRHKDA